MKVQSLGQDIDTPIVVEGELPTKPDEIAFHAESAKQLGVSVGDTITFEKDADADDDASSKEKDENTTNTDALPQRSFTVTALVNSAEYLADASGTYGYSTSPSGTIEGLAWVIDDAFDASAFHDGYPIVNVRCDSLAGMATFSEEYKQASNELKEPIETLGDTLATDRYDDLHDQAQEKIDDAKKTWSTAKIKSKTVRIRSSGPGRTSPMENRTSAKHKPSTTAKLPRRVQSWTTPRASLTTRSRHTIRPWPTSTN